MVRGNKFVAGGTEFEQSVEQELQPPINDKYLLSLFL